MRLLLLALLCALSYAQTDPIDLPVSVQDGQTDFVGICDVVEQSAGLCSAKANDCVISYCRESDNACFTQGQEYGLRCTTQAIDSLGVERDIQGVCVDSICVFTTDTVDCPDPILSAERTFISCGDAGFDKTWRFPSGLNCVQIGSDCQDFGPSVNNVDCQTSQTRNDDSHETYEVRYNDNVGDCIIGEHESCVISAPGVYEYMGMTITWSGVTETANTIDSRLQIPLTTKILEPELLCPSGFCRGTVICSMWGPEPCGRIVETCDGTYPPTLALTVEPESETTQEPTTEPTPQPTREPTSEPSPQPTQEPTTEPTPQPTQEPTTEPTPQPTREPTSEPTPRPTDPDTLSPTPAPTPSPSDEPTDSEAGPSSHGDPIIYTFGGDCYDLKKDGFYLASSHELYDHQVYIGIYNDYMREIQIRQKFTKRVLFAVNNLGEVFLDNWPHYWTENLRMCRPGKPKECLFFFQEFIFDAQELEYKVQLLGHDYADPGLKEGEIGTHLDIYPRPFSRFQEDGYTGLYFHNPIPFESGECYE